MTAKREYAPAKHPSSGGLALLLMSALAFFLILFGADRATEGMKHGLSLCAETVIPSLFPFMVVAELTVASGAAERLGHLLSPLLHPLFGIRGAAGSSLALGVLCGFPIGTKSAAALYESGRISRGELCRLLCICNQPSAAFVISAVGLSLFGSQKFGFLLYGITLLSGAIIGVIFHFLPLDDDFFSPPQKSEAKEKKGLNALPEAVSSAAAGMLTVSAFVCFFSTLIACLGALPAIKNLPEPLSAALVGFFELTGGAARAAACTSPISAACLAAGCLGWSGLSVHFQLMALCRRCNVSFRPYFAAKTAQGILASLMMAAAQRLFPAWCPTQHSQKTVSQTGDAWQIGLGLFATALLFCALRWGKKYISRDKIRQNSHKK